MLTEDFTITVPGHVKQAIRVPEKEMETRLLLELAIQLYEESLLSFGKARELARMSRWNFAEELSRRGIARHYCEHDLEEDIAFAGSEGADDGR